jgi:plastocyanin
MKTLNAVAILLVLAACGGDTGPTGDGGGGGGATVILQKPAGSGDAQTGMVGDTLAAPLVVLVTEDGVPVEGRVVTFTPVGVAGTLVPSVDTTGPDGKASAIWILGNQSGARQARATSTGATGSPLTFSATANPGPAASLVVVGGLGQVQEMGFQFNQPLIVRAADGFGNNVPNVIVTWAVQSGSATLSAVLDTTGSNGQSAVSVTAGDTAGEVSVHASVGGLAGSPVPFTLTVTQSADHVSIFSNFFTPNPVNINVGQAVTWDWMGGTHNVTPLTGPAPWEGSSSQSAGATFGPVVFTVAGTYTYECTLHSGMTAVINVGVASAPPQGVER